MLSHLECLHVRHLAISSIADYIGIALKYGDAEKSVVIRWLLGRWNAQPLMIRIK
jgi:hypothetical protein